MLHNEWNNIAFFLSKCLTKGFNIKIIYNALPKIKSRIISLNLYFGFYIITFSTDLLLDVII
jgi:hypothetical protein